MPTSSLEIPPKVNNFTFQKPMYSNSNQFPTNCNSPYSRLLSQNNKLSSSVSQIPRQDKIQSVKNNMSTVSESLLEKNNTTKNPSSLVSTDDYTKRQRINIPFNSMKCPKIEEKNYLVSSNSHYCAQSPLFFNYIFTAPDPTTKKHLSSTTDEILEKSKSMTSQFDFSKPIHQTPSSNDSNTANNLKSSTHLFQHDIADKKKKRRL